MKKKSVFKYLINCLHKAIYFFVFANLFIFLSFSESFSKEDIFSVNEIEIQGSLDQNFSRDKHLNKAFSESFKILMRKILLTRDLNKISNIKLNEIKNLINSFQIIEEKYSKDEYKVTLNILYDDIKVKKLLSKKNISFSQPESISVIFYPVLFVNDELKNFNENFFYNNWNELKIKNETINFVLPLEDLDDISKILKMKNNIEDLNLDSFINKYDIKNYVFALMDYQNNKLNIHLKTNFNNKEISKNIIYELKNINDEESLSNLLKNLKLVITDIWKEENLINLLMPLSIQVKFEHKKLKNLDELKNAFEKISTIDNYTLEKFNINNSLFKLYYYGNPKKLKSELSRFGYTLKNIEGFWQLNLND